VAIPPWEKSKMYVVTLICDDVILEHHITRSMESGEMQALRVLSAHVSIDSYTEVLNSLHGCGLYTAFGKAFGPNLIKEKFTVSVVAAESVE